VNLDADKVRQFQRAVGANPDGIFGTATLNLGLAWIAAHGGTESPEPTTPAQPPTGLLDPRSEGRIATLHPKVQQPFRDLLNAINAQTVSSVGLTGKWISGWRGEAEQNQCVANGSSKAPWPHSAHNGGGGKVGFACDIAWFDANGNNIENGTKYAAASAIQVKTTRAMGFHSGADFSDPDHSCLRPPSLRAMGETAFINALIYKVNNGLAVWP
jgi:hypothetical protein